MSNSKSIASILEYNSSDKQERTIQLASKIFKAKNGVLGIIGSGNFTSSIILPNLKRCNADIKYIASSGGLSSTIMAKKHNIVKPPLYIFLIHALFASLSAAIILFFKVD